MSAAAHTASEMAQTLEEAFSRLMAPAQPVAAERVPLADALGRVAAADAVAPRDVPGFRRAAMDGYVCHDADVAHASSEDPAELRVTGDVRMGDPPAEGPERGEAWSIATGGAMPLRGDRVVPLEAARRRGEALIVERSPEAKRHVADPGEDVASGARLVRAGEVIGPRALGALAACGIRDVAVRRRLRVALLATGDELAEGPDGVGPPGRIANTNAVTLAAELQSIGCAVRYRGIAPDRPEALREAFERAAGDDCDVVLSTGGVSVGPRDRVPRTWLDLGAERIVGRIDLKPGGPFFAARLGSRWAIGLSGSPAACLAAYHLLVRPLLLRLAGRRWIIRPIVRVALASGIDRGADRTRALWARVHDRGRGPLDAEILSGALGTLGGIAQAGALILLPEGTPPLRAGSRVAALLLDRPEDREGLVAPPARPAPLVVGVQGASGSGKTAVIAGLIRRLRTMGVRALAVKHAAHGFAIDRAGSDSSRMAEAGAAAVLVVGPDEVAVRLSSEQHEFTADGAVDLAIAAADRIDGPPPQVVFVEGFRDAGRPVILVGPPKFDAGERGGAWAALPAVSDLAPEALGAALDDLADRLRASLTANPAG